MIAMKRIFTVCIAIAVLVGSLLMQKIAKAADKEPTVSIVQESSTTGASSGSRGSSGAGATSDSDGGQASDSSSGSEPTPEQMKKRQKIIVY